MKELVKSRFKKMVKPFFSGDYSGCVTATATWETYEKRAAATKVINFGCNFDEYGRCHQKKDMPKDAGIRACCCSGCAYNHAYHEEINEEWLPTFEKLWDGDTGFWRAKQGCILPRKMRSVTCLTYTCNDLARLAANRLMGRRDSW